MVKSDVQTPQRELTTGERDKSALTLLRAEASGSLLKSMPPPPLKTFNRFRVEAAYHIKQREPRSGSIPIIRIFLFLFPLDFLTLKF